VEAGLELGAVVGLDDLDTEGQPCQDVVQELDGGLLIAAGVEAPDAQPGAVVDGGELVVLGPAPALWGRGERFRRVLAVCGFGDADGFDELDVDLDAVAGQLLP
jgi:hypothetical protein